MKKKILLLVVMLTTFSVYTNEYSCIQNEGYKEYIFDNAQKIDSVLIECKIPENSEIQLYNENGNGKTSISGCFKSGPFEGQLNFTLPSKTCESDVYGIRFRGENASSIEINDISFEYRNEEDWGKILPASYEFNQNETINIKPDRLWDSYITGVWYEPLYDIPYELLKEKNENQLDKIFGKNLSDDIDSAQIIWNLDGEYIIDTAKAYILERNRTVKFEHEEDGVWKHFASINSTDEGEHWYRSETGNIITKKVRITFPGGREKARFVTEIEIWGKRLNGKEEGKRNWREIFGVSDDSSVYYIEECPRKDYELEVTFSGSSFSHELYVNDKKINDYTQTELNGNKVVRFFIEKELLRHGKQFIKINSSEVKSTLIRETKNDGSLKEDGNYSYEKIIDIYENGYHEEKRLYGSQNLPEKEEGVVSRTIYASPLDKKCNFELYRPVIGEAEEEWNGSIIAWSGDYNENITINGQSTSRAGRYVYLPLERLDFNKVTGILKVNDTFGSLSKEYNYFVKGGKVQNGNVLTSTEKLEYTTSDSYLLEGIACNSDYQCYVNGKNISIQSDGSFKESIELKNGYQKIVIVLKDKNEIKAYWTKEIYRLFDSVKIDISGEDCAIYTNEENYLLKGRLWNVVNPELLINGTTVNLENGSFEYECDLTEGENTYSIEVRDLLGRTVQKNVKIVKDTDAPDFEILSPESEMYLSENTVEFDIQGSEENIFYVINNEKNELVESKKWKKEYELEDGFYDWTIYAVDKAGNKSSVKNIKFCVDSTKPESFTLEIDKTSSEYTWLNTEIINVSFSSEDETSGLDKYEYILDDGDWSECKSPLKLKDLSEGKHNLFVRAIDKAGNIRLENCSLFVDVTSPEAFSLVSNISEKEWTSTKEVILTLDVKDNVSGIKKYTLSIDEGVETEIFNGKAVPGVTDGKHVFTVRAYDYAGNVAASKAEYWIDSISPNRFDVSFDIRINDWSNNNTPKMTFETSDETSGIGYYEFKLDDNAWIVTQSGDELNTLSDGIHKVKVRAVDLAGNMSETCLYTLCIDTTCPLSVDNCRLISGNRKITGKWTTKDNDITSYYVNWYIDGNKEPSSTIVIKGDTLSEEGVKKVIVLPKAECTYNLEIDNGQKVIMTVQAEDKAGNLGPETETNFAITGISVAGVKYDEASSIEYDHITMAIPPVKESSGIKAVMIKEIDAPVFHENSVNPILSPIYSFTTIVDNNGKLEEQEHTVFDEEAVFFLSYDESIVPEGFPESNLEAYYYDEIWGRWFRAKKSVIDIEQNIIVVATNHFTNYSIQPTLMQDLTPEELLKSGHAYGNTESVTGDVTVSPESGTMIVESTEFVIHGRNGFEFPIKRIYDSQTARIDGPNFKKNMSIAVNFNSKAGESIAKQLGGQAERLDTLVINNLLAKFFERNGDYNLAVGAGWRLSLPYIFADNNNVTVRLPNGSFYTTNRMELIRMESNPIDLFHRNLVLENHIGDDFTLTVNMKKSLYADLEMSIKGEDVTKIGKDIADLVTSVASDHTVQGWVNLARSYMGWIIEDATLTMKDGLEFKFTELGAISEIKDPSSANVIKFVYKEHLNKRLIDKIIDPFGNEIKIEYNIFADVNRPYITSISKYDAHGNESKWEYSYKGNLFESAIYGLTGLLPPLEKVKDPAGRETIYESDTNENHVMLSGGAKGKLNVALAILDIWPPASAIKDMIGVYSLTVSGRIGIEFPQFLKTIIAPGKGTTEISYTVKDLSTFNVNPADYLFGFIPTAVELEFEYYQKIMVDSVTLINGISPDNEQNEKTLDVPCKITTYEYGLDMPSRDFIDVFTGNDYQYLVRQCVIKTKERKYSDKTNQLTDYVKTTTTNTYDFFKTDLYYRYTCVQDEILDILSTATLTTEDFSFERTCYTRLSSSITQKGESDGYEKTIFDWDNAKFRLIAEKTQRGKTEKTVNYEYDDWGNITKQTEVIKNSDSPKDARIKTTINHYYGTNSAKIEGFPYTGIKETVAQEVSGTKNLLISQSISDGYQTVYKANAYDKYARLIWSGIYNDNKWAVTEVGYNAVGEKAFEINPLGQQIDYEYSHDEKNNIKITSSWKDMNISTTTVKSKYTQKVLSEIDGNGNTTSYSYDSLGRIVSIAYPENKTDSFVYDDSNRTVSIKHEDDKVYEKYSYDYKNNLIRKTLYDYSKGDNKVQTIQAKLEYDDFDNVISMTDYNGNRTEYSYDCLNRLIKTKNADGSEKTVKYDDETIERTTTDENGNITCEILSFDGLVEKLIKGYNTQTPQTTSYVYDASGRVVETIEDPYGLKQKTKTEYSVFGEPSKITKPAVTVYENGNEPTVTPVEITEYNGMGLATLKMTGYEGNYHVEENTYDSMGRLLSVKTYALINGNVSDQVRTVSYTYDANGNVLTDTDADGNTKTYEYTSRNQKKSEKNPLGGTIKYVYDRNDRVIKQIDAMDFVAEYQYDDFGRLIGATLPKVENNDERAERQYTITYDNNGNALSMLEPGKKLSTWIYDSRNRKISECISGDDKNENCPPITRSWTYDGIGNIKTLKEADLETTYTYDAFGNVIKINYPDGQQEEKEYDKLNRVIDIKNAAGNSKTFDYNSLNLITSQTDEDGNVTEFKYDVWGNQTYRNEHNSNGNISGDQIWNITYNAFNQPVKEEKNDGTSWSYEYNGRGLLTKKKDPKGIVLENQYDACGRLKSETRTFGETREIKNYDYDENGFMYYASDNGVVSYINYVNGIYEANAYNLVTSLKTCVANKELSTSYTYDDALNQTSLSYPNGTTVNYSYNALGQLTAITNDSTNNAYAYASEGTYDSLGRLVSLIAGNGKITSRTWDEEKPGTLSGYSWGLDEYVSRSLKWDNLGNITSIVKGTETKPYTNTYEYDSLNRLIKEKNGADADITTKKIDKLNFKYVKNDIICDKNGEYVSSAVHFDYNAGSAIVDLGSRQKLSSLKVFGKNNRISPEYLEIWLSEDGIEWNQDTDVIWETDLNGLKASFPNGTEARYVKLHSLWDERDQDYAPVDKSTFRGNLWNLFEVSFTASGKENFYTYDARGNRLIENEKYGGNSNLTSTEYFYYANSDLIKKAGAWYFNYDKNGNLIAKGTSATAKSSISSDDTFAAWSFSETSGELWTYDYDLQNRMTKATYSDKGSANLKERSAYVYDYRGLLVMKTYQDYVPSNHVQVEGNQASKSVTEFYEYTPDGKILYTENSSTKKNTNYIWANQTLWCEINEGVVYYHHTDHLGTTEVITDCNGTVVWEAGYEAFGSVLSERGDSSFTPSYTGKFFDKSSGLYYFNARWYDSELGRFTSCDPARDGVNWWNYCNSSPLVNKDYDGLVVDTVWDSISLSTGVISLVSDVKAGNTKAAIIDSLGIVADGIAIALPFVPGGASVAIKAARATAAVANITAGSMTVADGISNGSVAEVASGALQIVGGASSATGLASRCSKEAKAKKFYKKSGKSKDDALSHMKGIDFNKDVKVKKLKKGTKLNQWQKAGDPQGSYYTNPDTSPNTLGIDSKDRIKTEYIVNKDTDVLQSTAADTRKIKGMGKSYQGKGGGIQYFSSEKENFSVSGN